MRAERGSISPDFRHQFTDAWTYELPFGPGKRYFNSNGPVHERRYFSGEIEDRAVGTDLNQRVDEHKTQDADIAQHRQ